MYEKAPVVLCFSHGSRNQIAEHFSVRMQIHIKNMLVNTSNGIYELGLQFIHSLLIFRIQSGSFFLIFRCSLGLCAFSLRFCFLLSLPSGLLQCVCFLCFCLCSGIRQNALSLCFGILYDLLSLCFGFLF